MNVYHLMQRPGSSTIQALGGLHRMAGWQRPIFTDSGGFQVYSLIRQNPKFGSISDRGAIFQPSGSGRKYKLTPEKSIQLQMSYGADVIICLDDCTHADDELAVQAESVRRQILSAAVDMGGTVSGEHGIGLAKRDVLGLEVAPDVIDLQRKLKDLYDPKGIMNPGKVWPA
jgi:hypothetical protein